MVVSLETLVQERDFDLRLVVPPAADATLTERIAWVHSSDLADPTPWLEPAQMLLTDGGQFLTGDLDPDDYVRRLRDSGVRALGFATEVLHPRIPDEVVEACRRHDLPLVAVPGRVPFLSIVRFVADTMAAESRTALEWSLLAHRALARAALQPDGLEAVLAELERQLGGWVALYDATGAQVPTATVRPVPADALPMVTDAVRTVLARGTRAAHRAGSGDTEITVQTLGQRNRLRGALVVGTPVPLDPARRDLVASVIALASIALDQTRRLDQARRRLRAGLLELLLSGEASVAHRTAEQLWGPLPREPLQVVQLTGPPTDLIIATLEQYVSSRPSQVFFAERRSVLHLIVTEPRVAPVLELLHGIGVSAVGVSSAVGWIDLHRGLDEARRASDYATVRARVVRFDDLAEEGLIGLLQVSGGQAVSRRLLDPVLRLSPEERTTLLDTVRVWTAHNCAWDPAAKELRVHRHTLRHRIDHLGQLLGLDLATFAGRTELWAAVRLLGDLTPTTTVTALSP